MTQARSNLWAARIAVLALAMTTLPAAEALAQKQNKKATTPATFNVLPINITSVTAQNGQLMVAGTLGSTAFLQPLIMTAQPAAAVGECPVLDLSLGPINLSLLGLNVDTSPICLEITAHQGGGLLGDLLCSIANLLNGGTPLATILGGLSSAQLNTLNTGLTTVLNQVFAQATSSNALVGASCQILNLAVGPLDLNLLGLQVELDDCSNGPVTVDITATPGAGLLGDLLCSLTNALNPHNPNQNALTLLNNIVLLIGRLIG